MNPNQPKKATIGGCSILIVFALILFFIVKSCISPDETEIRAKEEKAAFYSSQEYVKQNIKSPSTAKFPPYDKSYVTRFNDSTYVVKSYLDAQNGFGAMLRANYSCIILFRKTGRVEGFGFAIENQ